MIHGLAVRVRRGELAVEVRRRSRRRRTRRRRRRRRRRAN